MNVLIVDRRRDFGDALGFLAISKESEYPFCVLTETGGLKQAVRTKEIEMVVLAQNVLKTAVDQLSDMDVEMVCYCEDDEGISLAKKLKVPCIGIVKRPFDLISRLKDGQEEALSKTQAPDPGWEEAEGRFQPDNRGKTGKNSYEEEWSFHNRERMESLYDLPMEKEPESIGDTDNTDSAGWVPDPSQKERKARLEREHGLFADSRSGKKAAMIAVCSSKGGVGKTTLSCEIAEFLSMVWNGKKQMRVCLADLDIVCGDVRGTLRISSAKSLTLWASDIREQLKEKKDKGSIRYTKEEIEEYLSIDKRTGLYILPAPLSSEDSLFIKEEQLKVVLESLLWDGGFDYVICDTGSGMSDASVLAAYYADQVLLIADQGINTASCDMSFLSMMKTVGFDMSPSRVKLIINRIMPEKTTNISVSDLLEAFDEYECVGKISFSSDVIRATNNGKPLCIDKPDSEISKQLRKVCRYILGREEAQEAPKKKGRLAGLFHRKKR